jgi:hypothetical protein
MEHSIAIAALCAAGKLATVCDDIAGYRLFETFVRTARRRGCEI